MPAQINVVWWNKIKTDHGPKLPCKDLTKTVKKYEDALEQLERDVANSAKSGAELEGDRKKVLALFKAVQEALSEAVEACGEDEERNDLRTALNPSGKIKKDDATLKLIQKQVVLAWKREKAMNEAEAEYETAWEGFEELRDDREKAPSLELFDALDGQCTLLERYAEQCKATRALTNKYNIQLKVIAKERQTTQQARLQYQQALDACVQLRKDLLVDMKSARDALSDLYSQIETLVEQMTTYVDSKDYVNCSSTFDKIIKVGEAAEKAFRDGSEPFAPETVARNSLDIKMAKIHKDESTKYITSHITALITQNKANSNKNKEIQDLVQLGKKLMPARGRR